MLVVTPASSSDALDAAEVVRLVADDRSAERAAQLLLLAVALPRALPSCAKYSIAASFSSWKNTNALPWYWLVPGLRHRVDDAAGGEAVLGVELAGQQLEFLHRLDRHARLRAAVAAVERVVVVRPVHRVVDVAHVLAGDADRVGAERRRRNRRDHARQHAEIAGEVAVERRRVDELLRADAAADLLRRRVDERRLAGDGDRFGQPADFELELDLRGAHRLRAGRRGASTS